MQLTVNTNTQSLFAQRALRFNTGNLQSNIEHLSTGYRINRAADDAAGLSIANKLSTRIRGLDMALKNAADGISLIQTVEGGLGVIQENLQRIRELVVQGVNGTNGTEEKDALQREINERVKIIDDIAQNTKFNGVSLIYDNDATTANITLQTGSDDGEQTVITFAAGNNGGGSNSGIEIDITEQATGTSSDDGHLIEGATNNFALDRLQISGATVDSYGNVQGSHTDNIAATVADVDAMINAVSRMRSYVGATQNALQSKIEYMDIARENAAAARSRIQDVDVAKESSILIKNQILQQTAAAMLSQANTAPQIALQLLG
ncbi:MAG: flagellin [Candidatus Melainabacteria bacterium]|nr:flagellin [Candidatus Melainabacteria bacterium]